MAKNDKRAEVKQLISLGKEKGYLTYEEVHDVLPPDVVSPEHIDALMTLGDLDIDLVDPESPPEDVPGSPDNGLAAPHLNAAVRSRDNGLAADYVEDGRGLDFAADVLGKTDDPVRLYLREMGTIPLLTRDGEVEIAKRIEEGQNDVVQAIVCNALATQELLALSEHELLNKTDRQDPEETEAGEEDFPQEPSRNSVSVQDIVVRLRTLYADVAALYQAGEDDEKGHGVPGHAFRTSMAIRMFTVRWPLGPDQGHQDHGEYHRIPQGLKHHRQVGQAVSHKGDLMLRRMLACEQEVHQCLLEAGSHAPVLRLHVRGEVSE